MPLTTPRGVNYAEHHPVHLDAKVRKLGVYSAITNKTTWTLPFPHAPTVGVYLPTGEIITSFTQASETSIWCYGGYSGGDTVWGVPIDFRVELTRPFVRDSTGAPDLAAGFRIVKAVFACRQTPEMVFRTRRSGNSTDMSWYAPSAPVGDLVASFPCMGEAETTELYIVSGSPWPLTITGVEYHGDRTPVRI